MLFQKVMAGQRFLESLDALTETTLPIGIIKSGGPLDYSILIDRIEFTKEGALMDAYASLALPQANIRIAFHGRIPLSAQGGIAGTARLFLLGDHPFHLDKQTLVNLRSEQSYVEFDCHGFLGVNLQAELSFSSDFIRPEDEQGNILDDRLRVTFTAYTQSLNDILAHVSIPPFQITGLRGFGFVVNEAVIDWSDLINPAGMIFPESYRSPLITAGLSNLWRGIYVRQLEVRLPPAFASRTSGRRISVGTQNMLLDESGITAELYATNLIEDGDMNGWSYSLAKIAMQVASSHIAAFSIEGDLIIPVLRSADGNSARFKYKAQLSSTGDYLFAVAIEEQVKLDFWLARLKLTNGSAVTVRERDNHFYPSARLSGELMIDALSRSPRIGFSSIRFENMLINSEPPYFQPGTFAFGREGQHSSIAGYPLVIDRISVENLEDRAGIAFDLMVNIGGDPKDGAFSGKGRLVVWGRQDDPAGTATGIRRGSWTFDRIELSSLKVSIARPKIVELTGEVRLFENDNIYGDGFKGRLKGSIHTVRVEAEALFGRTETFRYWYADALVELKSGIPIIPGVLSSYGFGGGYYSHMKQSTAQIDGTLGKSPSGITYVPDENTIGIKAILLIGTTRPEVMRGDVALELTVNQHGGINTVTLTGNAMFMSAESHTARQIRELASAAVAGKLTEHLNSLSQGQVFGSMRLHFDNINDVFHGNLEVYINVAGGIVRGISPGNKAGWAELHFGKTHWHILIGTPDQPIGLEVARIFKAKSYLMIGKDLPGSPPPPAAVSEILGPVNLDYMRDLNALESGNGIAFGLHFLVDTGDLRFLIFYGRFSAGTGLDFMLKDYGQYYHCAGSNSPLGINGWYANGQAYAFVTGKIGIRVDLSFFKGRYEILSIGAATVLQAKGPNPFWMKGTVGGYYRILGGLVKGRCRFELTVGEDCTPVKEVNPLRDVSMIAGLTPEDTSSDISVFTAPQVAFNIPVGQTFEVSDMEGTTRYFRAILEELSVSDGGKRLSGTIRWNEDQDVAAFDPYDVLPSGRSLIVKVILSFEQMIGTSWTPVRHNGEIVRETAETTFVTGTAPDNIPESNIAFSYPAVRQSNFHHREYPAGYIQLRNGQPYLFSAVAPIVRITDPVSGGALKSSLNYDENSRTIRFDIPRELEPSREYNLEIVTIVVDAKHTDYNARTVEQELIEGESAGIATLTKQSLTGTLELPEERILLSFPFRTSRYTTFVEKMKNISIPATMRLSSAINVFQLMGFFVGDESFEEIEIGSTVGQGMVRLEAVLDDNPWYRKYVFPLLYDSYPYRGMKVTSRDPDMLGLPPTKHVLIRSFTPFRNGTSTTRPFSDEFVSYELGESVASDFFDLQRQAVNYMVDHPADHDPRIHALVEQRLPYLRRGPYRIRFKYVLPGTKTITSTYELQLYNSIPDHD